jgi:hypothetical protein
MALEVFHIKNSTLCAGKETVSAGAGEIVVHLVGMGARTRSAPLAGTISTDQQVIIYRGVVHQIWSMPLPGHTRLRPLPWQVVALQKMDILHANTGGF